METKCFKVETPRSVTSDDIRYHFTVTWEIPILEIRLLSSKEKNIYGVKVGNSTVLTPHEMYGGRGPWRVF
jgi:hypothetical protein